MKAQDKYIHRVARDHEHRFFSRIKTLGIAVANDIELPTVGGLGSKTLLDEHRYRLASIYCENAGQARGMDIKRRGIFKRRAHQYKLRGLRRAQNTSAWPF